ncbi:hypothetical protein WMY93_034303 [Mugilogobius chulae]|uniref:LINE-1 type transposase domain-containing protein 1 n=1 Tax=Mugilogobius chulae TaxID=88201 RepID=A0AAW0MFQ1_9GOBI
MTAKIMSSIDAKLDPLIQTVNEHTADLKRVDERLDEAEARVLQLETANEPLHAQLQALEKKVETLTEHVDELKNRGRRKNIRIFNIPENTEGNNAVEFFEHWLPRFLGMDTKLGRIKLERAHRSLAMKPGKDQPPRPIIARFHAFPDKQRVMAAVRRKAAQGDILLDGRKISFYNDLSAAVLRRRKEFTMAKQRLREIGADYAMLYPAKLKVSFNGAQRIFFSPGEVLSFASSVADQS